LLDIFKNKREVLFKMECPICMEVILAEVNCVKTDCGHLFHTSCLMKNTAVNGYDCPCCRAQMAEEPEESVISGEYESDDDDGSTVYFDPEEEEEFLLLGFRWFHQRIQSEELEGDAAEYEEMLKEEKEWDEESENASEEVKAKIDNILLGLKTIKSISYDELLKAFVHKNMNKFSLNHEAEAAFNKVTSTIQSIWDKDWSVVDVE
jgi:hypothetical protein